MLNRYPKSRPALPEEYARIYTSQYRENRHGSTPATALSKRMEAWLHRAVAADVVAGQPVTSTLEIGAGTLNHLQHEPAVGPYDVVEPFRELYEGSSLLERVRHLYSDIQQVPSGFRYDRIISIASLEHICNLPHVVARTGCLLTARGVFRVAIPSEGSILWSLGWRLTTGLEFRVRHGLDYGVLMRYEHVNTAAEIEAVLHHFYESVSCRVLGLSRALSLYQFLECRVPRTSRCVEQLAG